MLIWDSFSEFSVETRPSIGSLSGGSGLTMRKLHRGIFQAGICEVLGQSSNFSGVKTLCCGLKWGKAFKLEGNVKFLKGISENQLGYFTSPMTRTNSQHPIPLWLCLDNDSHRNLEKAGFITTNIFKKRGKKKKLKITWNRLLYLLKVGMHYNFCY